MAIILIAMIGLILMTALESLMAWLVVNQTLPVDQRKEYSRFFCVLMLAGMIQYPVGHWNLLGGYGGWIYFEHFALVFLITWAVLRLSFLRTFLAGMICWVSQVVVGVGYGIAFLTLQRALSK